MASRRSGRTWSNDEMICQSYDWYRAHKAEVLHAGGAASPHRSAIKQGVLALVRRFS